ncbi:ATP-binding protein [Luteibacter rhizovicinus]|uniref:ATP-binding protein n=1 Tax=Luteibacter rhizovicinus TaxID=242606 RepID=UPI0009034A7B|nr:ATP-binding protein [Luteibacter rhizovicinus]
MAQGNSTVVPDASEGVPEFHNFTVDAALFRELGERLVGRPHVALAELVKNAYDADASEVLIDFANDAITVTDNGHGMTRDEFLSFWMRVGTTHKQRDFRSRGLDRQVTGSKGVGRLSAQFLGDTLQLRTIASGEQRIGVRADVDWRGAKAAGDLIRAGATVRNLVAPSALANRYKTGVQVRIGALKHEWGHKELQELARELWFLRPPRALHGDLGADDDFVVRLAGVSSEDAHAFHRSHRLECRGQVEWRSQPQW